MPNDILTSLSCIIDSIKVRINIPTTTIIATMPPRTVATNAIPVCFENDLMLQSNAAIDTAMQISMKVVTPMILENKSDAFLISAAL